MTSIIGYHTIGETCAITMSLALSINIASGSEYLVTGDRHLLRLKSYGGIRILTVSDFLDLARA